jgi:hypothetical protein
MRVWALRLEAPRCSGGGAPIGLGGVRAVRSREGGDLIFEPCEVDVGLEGHRDRFLAICGVTDRPMGVPLLGRETRCCIERKPRICLALNENRAFPLWVEN